MELHEEIDSDTLFKVTATDSLYAAFSLAAARFPASIAIKQGQRSITYAALRERAHDVAQTLIASGVKPGDVVALKLERSIELIAAMIATLETSAVYLPVDPALPAERADFMLADSGAVIVVKAAEFAGATSSDLSFTSLESHHHYAAADDAYIIYTSGSTGTPKGVLVPQRSVIDLFVQVENIFRFDQFDTWTLFHSPSFDFSVWEIWGPLLHGGKLIIVPRETCRSPDEFWRLVVSENVKILNQTPSAFLALTEYLAANTKNFECPLRIAIIGGEQWGMRQMSWWLEPGRADFVSFFNIYGITEVTVHSSCRLITRDDLEQPDVNPIGHPLPLVQFHVLDEDMRPLVGEASGELYIGGSGLAREYIGRPDLTRDRFLTVPAISPDRLYRTGDIVQRNGAGEYVYLRRADNQLKIRGYRVEAGEIEAVIKAHPAVSTCAVIAKEFAPGDTRIVAYVVFQPRARDTDMGSDEILSAIKANLGNTLPDYMIPSFIVNLDKLPVNQNGKIDKLSLPFEHLVQTKLLSMTKTQARLLLLWCEVLCDSAASPEDDFFDHGGTSLSFLRLLRKINETFSIELSPVSFVDGTTLGQMASQIDRVTRAAA